MSVIPQPTASSALSSQWATDLSLSGTTSSHAGSCPASPTLHRMNNWSHISTTSLLALIKHTSHQNKSHFCSVRTATFWFSFCRLYSNEIWLLYGRPKQAIDMWLNSGHDKSHFSEFKAIYKVSSSNNNASANYYRY